jgi:hypothetical protein
LPPALTRELEDIGKRVADHLNGLLAFRDPWELKTKWLAFRLQDGTTDGTVYDSLPDAKKYTDESRNWYLHVGGFLQGIKPRDAAILTVFYREAHEAGLGQANPKDQPFLSNHGMDTYRRRYSLGQFGPLT